VLRTWTRATARSSSPPQPPGEAAEEPVTLQVEVAGPGRELEDESAAAVTSSRPVAEKSYRSRMRDRRTPAARSPRGRPQRLCQGPHPALLLLALLALERPTVLHYQPTHRPSLHVKDLEGARLRRRARPSRSSRSRASVTS